MIEGNINADFQARKDIFEKIHFISGEPEMIENESAFLCGLIKEYRPKKIVEIGIAGGGTSAIIAQCLSNHGMDDVEFHSIDFSERFYRNEQYESGFLGKMADEVLDIKFKHIYHLGDVACAFATEIGDEIDFLILDTMHRLPGEVLDFITLLPYLKNGCIVVLHDVTLHLRNNEDRNAFATGVLFSAVVGEKIMEDDAPNIAAFIVEDDTRKYIENVFLSLFITWNYYPEKSQIEAYRNAISLKYDQKLLGLFDAAVSDQNMVFEYERKKNKKILTRMKQATRILLKGGSSRFLM